MVNWVGKIERELSKPFRPKGAAPGIPLDFTPFQKKLVALVKPFTMTSIERVAVLEAAVRHVIAQGYPGALVECGVAAGGSVMAMAYTLIELGASDRDIYLFDTFEGMPEPTDLDKGRFGESARGKWVRKRTAEGVSTYINHGLDEVKANVARANYPAERLHFIKGKVEETLPAAAPPGDIALLRLDTDWHDSTQAEMEHLYPKLVKGGIILIDDYARWQGSRKAVDDYTALHSIPIFWARIDDTAVIGVKP
jgi:O-methyltransferase